MGGRVDGAAAWGYGEKVARACAGKSFFVMAQSDRGLCLPRGKGWWCCRSFRQGAAPVCATTSGGLETRLDWGVLSVWLVAEAHRAHLWTTAFVGQGLVAGSGGVCYYLDAAFQLRSAIRIISSYSWTSGIMAIILQTSPSVSSLVLYSREAFYRCITVPRRLPPCC